MHFDLYRKDQLKHLTLWVLSELDLSGFSLEKPDFLVLKFNHRHWLCCCSWVIDDSFSSNVMALFMLFYSHLRLCLYLPLTETLFPFFYPSLLITRFSPEAKVVRPTQDPLRAARATGTSLVDSRNSGWWWNQTFPTSLIFINSIKHNQFRTTSKIWLFSDYCDCSVCHRLLWDLNPAFHDLPLF